MENIIRLPKGEIYDDTIHEEPYLVWIQKQADRISKFADVIEQLKDDNMRRVVSPMKVYECAAKFTEFYIKNIAFKAIYEELASEWKKKSDDMYDEIYLEIKTEVTDYSTLRGTKYKKKDATQKEIEKEMKTHTNYKAYEELNGKAEEYGKKANTQDDYIKGLGKHDQILNMLQKASQTEMKFLYLET